MESSSSNFESIAQAEAVDAEAETRRLQHGIAVLNFFDQEDEAHDRLSRFVRDARPGSESREQILHGQSYRGDVAKLDRAVNRARKKYAVSDIKRRAILEHAAYEGVPAVTRGRVVEFEDENDEDRVMTAHAQWRVLFATPQRTQAREIQRAEMQARIEALKGVSQPADQLVLSVTDEEFETSPPVDIRDRAFHIYRAVQLKAHISKLAGLGVAVRAEYKKIPIWKFYGDETGLVAFKAENRAERLAVQAARDFWQASGYQELHEAGGISRQEFEKRSQHDWDKFSATFDQSPNQNRRLEIRKKLGKFLAKQEIATIKAEVSGKSHS